MKWALLALGVVAAVFVAATFGPHKRPWVAGFAEVLEDDDDY